MTSPFIPSPFQYTDIPGGGQQAIIIVSATAPTVTQNLQSPSTFWLSSLNLFTQVGNTRTYGTGKLYYLAGFTSGVPQWTQIASGLSSEFATTAAMTAGAVTVTNPFVTSASKIVYSRATLGGTAGNVSITAQSNGSFTLTSSSNTETSTFTYQVIN